MFSRKMLGVLALGLLWPGNGMAVPLTIVFNGTVSPGSEPVSNFELLYYASDPNPVFVIPQNRFGFIPLAGSCAGNATCGLSGSMTFDVPLGWSPTTSKYTILGYYDGGPGPGDVGTPPGPFSFAHVFSNPRVFVLTDPGFLGGGVFESLYQPVFLSETTISTHIYNGWTDPYPAAAASDAATFMSLNLADFPNVALDGSFGLGTIWDYSGGLVNGSASFEAHIQSDEVVPEPSTVVLLSGGLGLLTLAIHRRRRADHPPS